MERELLIATLAIATIGAGAPARAQSHEKEEKHGVGHEIGLVMGGSYVTRTEENFLTLGGDYEVRIHRLVGIEAGLEYAARADAAVVSFPVVVHLSELSVFAGPGIEATPREHEGLDHDGRHGGSEEKGGAHFLFRVGGQYAFPLSARWRLTPFVALDLVNEHEHVGKVVVYGIKLVMEL